MDRKKFMLSQMIKVKPIIEKEGVVIHYSPKPQGRLVNIDEPAGLRTSAKKAVRLMKACSKTNQIRFSK